MEQGVRKSLSTPDGATFIEQAEDLVLELKSFLREGATAFNVNAEGFISRLLKIKRVPEADEGKAHAGRWCSLSSDLHALI